ncbi:eukaryotic translation initiation factor-like protein subunit eIF2A [Venturia nashicola]|uniref:Eukaryotic translation initiation factor 2A n=1 Tax=Venturia nashicola TaxID=86259 RepID=A0A4Z1NJZ4_9PEZI|nr:eukaryotic translation initiation factor-like protein subunit eIF2A [Venturia nashicola]TLD19991.1 eukaryotic translation initiation factor-like protein subunit eIF2A [Venturia nashicola]
MAEPTQLAYRTLKGIGVFNAAPAYESLPAFAPPEGHFRCCTYSPDGKFFAWADAEKVTVVDASAGHVVTTLPAENVYELGFSPLGTYIITWQRPMKDENGDATKNLKVWRTLDDNAGEAGERAVVGQFVQRSQTGWNLQYTEDEKYCARVVTNQVQFYESGDLKTVWNKLIVEGVTDFAVSPGETHSVAIFVPERKGMPAAVKVYAVPEFSGNPVSQKTFFKGDKVTFKWNSPGSSLIVLAQTDVDKSNKSYYGETTMHILSANGGFDSRIQLDKEGPVHDVAWSPNGKEFGVVYGYMPAKTTIFNARAVPTHTFPLGPRNTILFSPHGRFVLVAGFGNLAGQMDIYDLSKNYTKVCTIEGSNASVCEWSPDGSHILTATISPRLRVDNGVRIWHVSGGLMYNEDMTELYHVTWRPQSAMTHPPPKDTLNPVPVPHPSASTYLGRIKAPSKPVGAYRPPGARGTSTPLAFKREDEGGAAFTASNGGTTAGGQNGFGRQRRQVPGAELIAEAPILAPGAAPGGGVSLAGTGEGADENLSKAALKNKKKREAKKAKEALEKQEKLEVDGLDNVPRGPRAMSRSPERRHQRTRSGFDNHDQNQGRSPHRGERRPRNDSNANSYNNGYNNGTRPGMSGDVRNSQQDIRNQPQQIQQRQAPIPAQVQMQVNTVKPVGPPPGLTVTSPQDGGPNEKKIRSLHKKVRAIEELKMRQAAGEKLEDTQIRKIDTEAGIRKELAALGDFDN